MIRIFDIGMNHETAPVDLRECLAAEPENDSGALSFIRDQKCIQEGIYISTCNRVETLFTTSSPEEARIAVTRMMSRFGDIPEDRLIPSLYTHRDMDAVKHVFRVASSLDSMVIGEPQILGQIKEAYALATHEKTSGVVLNRLMHKAFHVAKRVRTETDICEAAVSISFAAIELAKKIFHELEGKTVLLIGAGEMAELSAKHLVGQGVQKLMVANRTFERAVAIAREFDATPISFDEIPAQLSIADIVVTSTASPEYIIRYENVKEAVRKRRSRPLFFIDIAVPRDVEPTVNKIENVYVYDIDDLKGVVEANLAQRQEAAVKAERIVQEETIYFKKWLETLDVVPTIKSLREKAAAIMEAELNKSRASLAGLTPEQKQAVETLTRSITEKMLNDPILFLKRKTGRSSLRNYLDVARSLFNLDGNSREP